MSWWSLSEVLVKSQWSLSKVSVRFKWSFGKVFVNYWWSITNTCLDVWSLIRPSLKLIFLTFPADFYFPIIFTNLNYNCSIFWDLRNLQEQVEIAFCYQKLFWPFTVWINCSCELKNFENSWLSASNFKSFSRSLEQFFLTVGQNNFGNKIPFQSGQNPLNFCHLFFSW